MTFLLTKSAKQKTWGEWVAMGGCGLSDGATNAVGRATGLVPAVKFGFERKTNPLTNSMTLGKIQEASLRAGREIARFGKYHLNLTDWAQPEYPTEQVNA